LPLPILPWVTPSERPIRGSEVETWGTQVFASLEIKLLLAARQRNLLGI
jgi:hypothetical protein